MINSLLLLSQLVIPSLPSNVTPEHFIQESIKTVSCVGAVEEDAMVQALSQTSTQNVSTQILIVAVKDAAKTKACAQEVAKAFDLKIEGVLPTLGLFVVSYEASAGDVAECFLTHSCLK